ncbi:MAG: hypothetical protein BWX88_00850 [Planctomycetes bacterium ADurb.Bin126]|nr:MAG: hypothetical protein BWX88_00850 [Planctomycetes bacterium ADurb.Bin126]HOD80494.1 hypothetical protein [Phycisphaerae bacterium]HQL72106.1 hypothetical protein [Phycisphaerae bacterium]
MNAMRMIKLAIVGMTAAMLLEATAFGQGVITDWAPFRGAIDQAHRQVDWSTGRPIPQRTWQPAPLPSAATVVETVVLHEGTDQAIEVVAERTGSRVLNATKYGLRGVDWVVMPAVRNVHGYNPYYWNWEGIAIDTVNNTGEMISAQVGAALGTPGGPPGQVLGATLGHGAWTYVTGGTFQRWSDNAHNRYIYTTPNRTGATRVIRPPDRPTYGPHGVIRIPAGPNRRATVVPSRSINYRPPTSGCNGGGSCGR